MSHRSHINIPIDSGGDGGARAPTEVWGSEKGQSLISAYWSLATTTNPPDLKNYLRCLSITAAGLNHCEIRFPL